MYSLCLKTLPKMERKTECVENGDVESKEQAKVEREKTRKSGENVCKTLQSTELAFSADVSTAENGESEDNAANHIPCVRQNKKCDEDGHAEKEKKDLVFKSDLPTVQAKCNDERPQVKTRKTCPKDEERKEIPMLFCRSKAEDRENLTIQRSHTSPKLKMTKNSKQKNKSHRRALSFDSKVQNKNEIYESKRMSKHNAIQNNPYFNDLVIVVDNSNIFIGAQECSTLLNPNERKRNIRVKIQQLVKVFQRGRNVSRAFVQGSSPPTTEQVWEVYR
jgi:hypothetical protein